MAVLSPPNLEQYRIVPELEIYYIQEFISVEHEAHLLDKINAHESKWVQLKNRRLQAHPSQLINGTTLVAGHLPAYLNVIKDKLTNLGIFADSPHKEANHVLINEYRAGQGIDPHEDGDAYFPLVATVTLVSHCVYNLLDKQRNKIVSLLQEPRSCLITKSSAYTNYLHGIAETVQDIGLNSETIANWHMLSDDYKHDTLQRGTRISLTYRDVIKQKMLLKLGR